jgi:ATP-dependent RNA helicase RhlB
MRHEAARVARHLEHNGYKCQHITGDLAQSKRLEVINHFKEGKLPILVATDVAARGLHVEDLELIINYDLPGDCESYVHRIGRTARAGKSGKAISLACEKYIYNLEAIETFIGMKIPVAYAGDDLFLENKAEGMTFNFDKPMGSGRGRPDKRPYTKTATRTKSHPHKTSTAPKARPPLPKTAGTESKKIPRKEAANRRLPTKSKTKQSQTTTPLEQRLEYYKKKYGDNFNIQTQKPAEPAPQKIQKKSLIKKIAGFFKRKR